MVNIRRFQAFTMSDVPEAMGRDTDMDMDQVQRKAPQPNKKVKREGK